MFRRRYWITERLEDEGTSQATGVYTSVYDLVTRGLPRHDGGLRLTIAALDSEKDPIAHYASPGFQGLHDDLTKYVAQDEITDEQRRMLLDALKLAH